ncbi:MAG TPA: hypothetical protein VGP82_16835, partial [Ktedonobacterales bacterium]|nr:hypothetical protein [Ktedonobacterales bacterium]
MNTALPAKTTFKIPTKDGDWITITSEVRKITPALARELLKRNTNNRALRPAHVDMLRGTMQRGEWQVTHQGLAFADDGELLDGQHRLEALGTMPDDFFCFMKVETGYERDT